MDPQSFLPELAGAYSYLYAVLRPDTQEIKIGIAHDPVDRLRVLQTGSAAKLLLLLAIPCAYGDEKVIHARWDHLRLSGEWFRADGELMGWVAAQREAAAVLPRRELWLHAPATCAEATRGRPCRAHAASRVFVGDDCRPVCHIHLPQVIARLGDTAHRVETRPAGDGLNGARYRKAIREATP